MARVASILGSGLIFFMILASGIWAILAIFFSGPHNETVRYSLAAIYAAVLLLSLMTVLRRRWRYVLAYPVLFATVLVWFLSLEPSNDRNWQTDVTVLPYATVEGNLVTVHNIRNFDYRSETDYTPSYYDKQFDLDKLDGADLVAVYWMGPSIAHVLISFAFGEDDHLAVSIETRKEKGEDYSTLKGFFRQYELHYVVADERDVIRLRTNYRHNPPEDVYVYRATASNENIRRLFMEYINRINALKNRPEWYNTLTTNCTTNIWKNTHVNATRLAFNWKILVSGYVPELLYERGRLVTNGMSFADLTQKSHVNARAQAADVAEDFSRRIRE